VVAVMAVRADAENPLAALSVGEAPSFSPPDDWVPITPLAGSINHHDIWSLRGVGLSPEQLPMVLGTDAAGLTASGERVLVYPVIIESNASELGADGVSLLSEKYPGTFSDQLWVPPYNLIPIPASLSDVEAGCLSTAWLTAYRMLTTQAAIFPPSTGFESGLSGSSGLAHSTPPIVLVQGAGGGVSTAAIVIAKALGATVWVTSRDASKRSHAMSLGADQAFEPGVRLPSFVDVVIETVGEATWSHSLKAVKSGGVIVVSGATSGSEPKADLRRVFRRQIRIQGSSMGTPSEMSALLTLLAETGARPTVAATYPRSMAAEAFKRIITGQIFGKVVLVAD
jgi:NADPH:quinone reductase-like Zn-dependent oxidoreductase